MPTTPQGTAAGATSSVTSRRDQPEYFRRWAENQGCEPRIIDALVARGADRGLLQIIRKQGVTNPAIWLDLLDAGLDKPVATSYIRAGITDPLVWLSLLRCGVTADDVDSFTRLGVTRSAVWIDLVGLGISGAIAAQLHCEGLTSTQDWVRWGLHRVVSRDFAGQPVTAADPRVGGVQDPAFGIENYLADDEIADFFDAGVRHSLDCLRFSLLGVRGSEARAYADAGILNPDDWVRAVERGLTARDLRRMGRSAFLATLRSHG